MYPINCPRLIGAVLYLVSSTALAATAPSVKHSVTLTGTVDVGLTLTFETHYTSTNKNSPEPTLDGKPAPLTKDIIVPITPDSKGNFSVTFNTYRYQALSLGGIGAKYQLDVARVHLKAPGQSKTSFEFYPVNKYKPEIMNKVTGDTERVYLLSDIKSVQASKAKSGGYATNNVISSKDGELGFRPFVVFEQKPDGETNANIDFRWVN